MTTEQVIKHFGGAAKVAEALCIGRSAVSQWGDEPPLGRQFQIEIITDGQLKASTQKEQAA